MGDVAHDEAVRASKEALASRLQALDDVEARVKEADTRLNEARRSRWVARWARRQARADAKAHALNLAERHIQDPAVQAEHARHHRPAATPSARAEDASGAVEAPDSEAQAASPAEEGEADGADGADEAEFDIAQAGREVYARALISYFVRERKETDIAQGKELELKALAPELAAAHEAALAQVAAARESAEAANAALSAAGRYRDMMPSRYFDVAEPLRELLETATYLSFARKQQQTVAARNVGIEREDLQAAAVAINARPGEHATDADLAQGLFDGLPAAVKAGVDELIKQVADGHVPIVQLVQIATGSEQPSPSIVFDGARGDEMRLFLVVQSLCKGRCKLPPSAACPWRWSQSWEPVLTAGAEIGRDFSKGLLACSRETSSGKTSLDLRGQIGGHRPTAIRAVSLLLHVVTSADLRDNQLSGAELVQLGSALAGTDTLKTIRCCLIAMRLSRLAWCTIAFCRACTAFPLLPLTDLRANLCRPPHMPQSRR